MTTRIINYFKIYAKYDKQQHNYYINNLKSVFEHYYKYNEDNELIDDKYVMNDVENDIKTSISGFKQFENGCYSYIELDQKQIINDDEHNNTIYDIIDIFNF